MGLIGGMRLIRGLLNVPEEFPGCVATVGNFDGVHLGHQNILRDLKQKADALTLPTLVMMFEPQSREYFSPQDAPARISGLADKLTDLAAHNVDCVLLLPFNEALRSMSARDFMQTILVDGIGTQHLIVGDDFHFGCDRSGDYQALKAFGAELIDAGKQGFTVADTPTFEVDGDRVSSTRVRTVLALDDLDLAERLLGQRFRISGRIGYGRQLGSTIGAPTANILLKRTKLVSRGVFAVTAKLKGDDRALTGVANLGIKPTISGESEPSLEVHVFDIEEHLYGKRLEVTFIEKIRDEKKFSGLDELKAAIADDIAAARIILA